MPPDIDYKKIGQRIKQARLRKGLTQADLGTLVGCSNNYMSHIEVGQTKASLSILLKLAFALDTDLDYFLMDTPYVKKESIINTEISTKLSQCDTSTLLAVNKMIDVLLEQQNSLKNTNPYY